MRFFTPPKCAARRRIDPTNVLSVLTGKSTSEEKEGNFSLVLPWYIKMGAKIVLSRLPVDYRVWSKLHLFRHGAMDQPEYAYNVFSSHFRRLIQARADRPPKAFTCLEVGPGDSLVSALIAASFGSTKTYLVDSGPYASRSADSFFLMAKHLRNRGTNGLSIDDCTSVDQIMQKLHATYLTNGLESMNAIPSNEIDLIWSQAVVEHLPKDQCLDFFAEMHRMLKPDGIATHRIDLRDHLQNGLNNLRFSERVWESALFKNSGFYTNRIRWSEYLHIFEQSGLEVLEAEKDEWKDLPLSRRKMNTAFSHFSDEDLKVLGFNVVLRPTKTS